MVFSHPANPVIAARVEADSRYWQQFARRNVPRVLSRLGYNPIDFNSLAALATQGNKVHPDWSENLGSGASVGAGNFPALYNTDALTANCANATKPDYVVFNTGLAGSSAQASVIAFDNLYSGCAGSVPRTYWAYNTGGQVLTSPVISEDGTRCRICSEQRGYWKPGSPEVEGFVRNSERTGNFWSGYPTVRIVHARRRALTTIILRAGSNVAVDDTTSSAYPDYSSDTLYVGGNLSWLHKDYRRLPWYSDASHHWRSFPLNFSRVMRRLFSARFLIRSPEMFWLVMQAAISSV